MPRSRRLRLALATAGTCAMVAACSRESIKKALGGGEGGGDPVWRADSTLLASEPEVLFRVLHTANGTEVAPIATIGAPGYHTLLMGNRGWRAFDLQYLHQGSTLVPYRDGRALDPIKTARGMWGESGPVLDSVPRCIALLPSGVAPLPSDVEVVTNRALPPLKPFTPLSDNELQSALAQVAPLIAPVKGVPLSLLPRYSRTVRQVNNGRGGRPTIVVIYNDPDEVPDTAVINLQRPRQLVVILDYGSYGYKPSYTFATVGNKLAQPRMRYLDYIDVDNDGKPELLFNLVIKNFPLLTLILRQTNDTWQEMTRYNYSRCELYQG